MASKESTFLRTWYKKGMLLVWYFFLLVVVDQHHFCKDCPDKLESWIMFKWDVLFPNFFSTCWSYLGLVKKSSSTSRWPFFFYFFVKKWKKVKKSEKSEKKYFQQLLMLHAVLTHQRTSHFLHRISLISRCISYIIWRRYHTWLWSSNLSTFEFQV